MTKTILFVCLHGAAKSRMAAAFFNQLAPLGWQATSAGQEPQAEMSQNAIRLLADTEAATLLDLSPPRSIAAVTAPERTIAIDCTVSETESWRLEQTEFNPAMREEIRLKVANLISELTPN